MGNLCIEPNAQVAEKIDVVKTVADSRVAPEAELPLAVLSSFLFFLARRPVSASNLHYFRSRLRGLKTLLPMLEAPNAPTSLSRALRELNMTTPVSFGRRARMLQMNLLAVPRGYLDFPGDYLVTEQPPQGFADGISEAIVILGPSIGIGDEITTFPLPGWLKASGVVRVRVMTTYRGLWNRVLGVDEVTAYADHAELVAALRANSARSTLIALIDFEKPGLAPVMARESGASRYLDLSLGGQTAVFLHREGRRAHAFRMPTERLTNYYDGLDRIARWLGLRVESLSRFSGIMKDAAPRTDDEIRVFVSPFTSKFDPSSVFWAKLLALVFPGPESRRVRIRVDAGANGWTTAFAEVLSRSVASRVHASVQVEVAHGSAGPVLPLSELWTELERAHVVVCTDSFVAHAAPVCGARTLVLAGPELANWRVPYAQSFYFNAQEGVEALAAAVRTVISAVPELHAAARRPPLALLQSGHALFGATRELEVALGGTRHLPAEAYRSFLTHYALSVDGLSAWPPEYATLFSDVDYARPWRDALSADAVGEACEHMRNRLGEWANSNFYKFLGLSCTP